MWIKNDLWLGFIILPADSGGDFWGPLKQVLTFLLYLILLVLYF